LKRSAAFEAAILSLFLLVPDNFFTNCLRPPDNSIPPFSYLGGMKTNRPAPGLLHTLIVSAVLVVALNVTAQPAPSLDELCRDAVVENSAIAEKAIHALRAHGPEGLQALLTTHAATIKKHATTAHTSWLIQPEPDADWLRLRAALDAVSQQRDCFAARLYWFTDFEQAKAAAKTQGKPILSLRLLGKLDEEFSCANSRFFRTTLYANAEVAQFLRDHFVLHWKSVRPVPRVTIDFGDGRKLERTITGNSIHYVLSPEGEVVDALPGLYGAKAFLRGLHRAEEIAHLSATKTPAERRDLLAGYHRNRIAALEAEVEQDLKKISAMPAVLISSASPTPVGPSLNAPTANVATLVTASKGRVEFPILDRTMPAPPAVPRNGGAMFDDATWQKIAAIHADDASLDLGASTLIRAKGPNAIEASRVALSKSIVEDPMLRKLRSMERSISEDTVRNEYQLHYRIHEWLARDAAPPVDQLNARVYAELFLTPDSDPWLGLLPDNAYAALENDGLSLTTKH
jgi:hypothetical protein